MKSDKLSPKAITILANMLTAEQSISSSDLSGIAPNQDPAWALSALRRLADMKLLSAGPRRDDGEQSFVMTEAGRDAVLKQARIEIQPEEQVSNEIGVRMFFCDAFGARRLALQVEDGFLVLCKAPDGTSPSETTHVLEDRFFMGSLVVRPRADGMYEIANMTARDAKNLVTGKIAA